MTIGARCDDSVRFPRRAILFGTPPYRIAIGGELVVVPFAAEQSLLAAAEVAGVKLPANCRRMGSAQRASSDSTSGPSRCPPIVASCRTATAALSWLVKPCRHLPNSARPRGSINMPMIARIESLCRYAVKSMRGEVLEQAVSAFRRRPRPRLSQRQGAYGFPVSHRP
jgi:hypothetical protein